VNEGAEKQMDVKIGEVAAELMVTEGTGSLSREEVQKIVNLAVAQMRTEMARTSQMRNEATVRDRVFRPEI
jgi:hypothetical protein